MQMQWILVCWHKRAWHVWSAICETLHHPCCRLHHQTLWETQVDYWWRLTQSGNIDRRWQSVYGRYRMRVVFWENAKTLRGPPGHQSSWYSRVDVQDLLVTQTEGYWQFAEWRHCCTINCLWCNARWWKVVHMFTQACQELSTCCWYIRVGVR